MDHDQSDLGSCMGESENEFEFVEVKMEPHEELDVEEDLGSCIGESENVFEFVEVKMEPHEELDVDEMKLEPACDADSNMWDEVSSSYQTSLGDKLINKAEEDEEEEKEQQQRGKIMMSGSAEEAKKHSRRHCSFAGCGRSKAKFPELHFYSFPVKRPWICELWTTNCANEVLHTLEKKTLGSRVVCEKHFEKDCFFSGFKTRLTGNAVPTIPCCVDDEKNHQGTSKDAS
ncbi:hypothetical protein LSTR_LSTR006218 [Laodelphax striatellus]|uniref:THAP-type domain-containing protein n=1 Tax=Laodelphax striatellus TaxID=195883 RepID=A0A482XTL1_LAOST|nr:hypothetical protein LSTR_LSTR006218 [Laodelphax striatellus]